LDSRSLFGTLSLSFSCTDIYRFRFLFLVLKETKEKTKMVSRFFFPDSSESITFLKWVMLCPPSCSQLRHLFFIIIIIIIIIIFPFLHLLQLNSFALGPALGGVGHPYLFCLLSHKSIYNFKPH
jgi:hypothetical protein